MDKAVLTQIGLTDYEAEVYLALLTNGQMSAYELAEKAGLYRQVTYDSLKRLMEKGFDIGEGDGLARAKKVECLQYGFFRITLTEGKKRQIRRMFMELGFKILDLKRVELAGLKIAGLPEGSWDYLSEEELSDLKKRA